MRKGLTDGSRLALPNRLHYADDTAGLQGRLEPVGGVLHVGHVNAQAAILTQQDHCGPLLLIAGRMPNGNHVLDLAGDKGGCYFSQLEIRTNRKRQRSNQFHSQEVEKSDREKASRREQVKIL